MTGWECPKCGRVNAPWKEQCSCSEPGLSSWPLQNEPYYPPNWPYSPTVWPNPYGYPYTIMY